MQSRDAPARQPGLNEAADQPGAVVQRMVASSDGSRWAENRAPERRLARLDLPAVWSSREAAWMLALRDVKLRYQQTFFGVAWAVIQPLAGAALFAVIFSRIGGVPRDGVPYLVFVYTGFVAWTYFSNAVAAAAESLVESRELVTKIFLPRILLPLAAVVPALLDLAISLMILALLMAIYEVTPTAAIALLPAWIVATVVLAFSFGLWLSALNARYRDVRYALPFIIQMLFFATPVLFSTSLFEGVARYVFALNPLVGLLDGIRWSVLDAPAPGVSDLVSLGSGLLLATGGLVYFLRCERDLADVI